VVRTYVVREGDSLPSIAYASYGSATRWRPIALANRIVDPLDLPAGRTLLIPAAIEDGVAP
jgi:nucleoid-associated protein YgaU